MAARIFTLTPRIKYVAGSNPLPSFPRRRESKPRSTLADNDPRRTSSVPFYVVQLNGDEGLDSRLRGNDGWASEMKTPCVYIMASKPHGTLYTGVTSDLVQRVWQHRNKAVDGFTRLYNVHFLVWYELHETMENAINREKALKKWNRAWKIKLIELTNPLWEDLYEQII